MPENTIIRAKCVVFGDSTAGKTSLVQAFLTEGSDFPKNYNMTLGVDIETKLINVPDTNYSVELFLFDCSGKEFYRSLVAKMSSQPSLVLLVYDVTNEQSFKCVTDLYNQIKGQHSENLNGVLFANKTDLTSRRIISPKSGRDLAHSLGLQYFEGSAKDHQGIEEPFFFLVNEWFKTFTDKAQSMKLIT